MMFFKGIFNKRKRNFFIHIPKTGGSTFVGILKDSVKITSKQKKTPTHIIDKVGNTEIRHVDFKRSDRPFKSPDIFEVGNRKKLSAKFNFFMIVRHPVDRLVSEFNFQYHVLNGKNGNTNAAILARLHNNPKNLHDYIVNRETQNYQCKFLLGRKIADPQPITDDEFSLILETINKLPINIGTTDQYDKFLYKFEDVSGIKLKRNVLLRKRTPNKFKFKLDKKVYEKIIELNSYDYQLYKVATEANKKYNYNSKQFNFNSSQDYIV